MTNTTTTDPEDTANTEDRAAGTIEHIDPHTLVLDPNVRDEPDVDADFLASIKEHGVLIPIAAVRDANGQVRVRSGQRRTLVAREAGLSTVPVYVRPASVSDERAQLVERVSEQIVENDQRRQITDAHRVRGIQQMLDAGLSVTRVAKTLSVAKDTVKAAGSAAKSTAAMDALASGQLSLIEAAAITEFEDLPGALERLLDVARPSGRSRASFPHAPASRAAHARTARAVGLAAARPARAAPAVAQLATHPPPRRVRAPRRTPPNPQHSPGSAAATPPGTPPRPRAPPAELPWLSPYLPCTTR
jgi:ParB family chromosome partitioning protein